MAKSRDCVTALGPWLAGRPACYQLAHGRPMGVQGGGQAYRAAVWLGARETKLDLKLGALLNTVQGSLLPTYHARIQTHTHTHTHTLRVAQWAYTYLALALWLNSPPCKWSGVEWRCADLQMAQLMLLPLTISCSSKSRLVLTSWFYFLVPAHPDSCISSSKHGC